VTDLKRLLEPAAETTRAPVDPIADLVRAQRTAKGRTLRRVRLAAVTAAVVVVSTVGLNRSAHDPTTPEVASKVELVAATFDADPYTFDLTPTGWHVQSQNAFAVTIAPDDGSTSDSPDVFVGKLVILFDQNPLSGATVDVDGRRYWLHSDSDYTTISTATRPDEPPGAVRIQYPDDAGWTRDSMLAFLGSVHVGPGALPGLG
jgi:hypothetical protein